ncbi:MAG: ABC transporter substrate-binding protein [Clostridia bacterium]|nr:ABC transporter substrate-binding protein [Clostridia bacterium]
MKKIIAKCLAFITVGAIVFSSVGCSGGNKENIKIAGILPVTGNSSVLAGEVRTGMEMAIEKINGQGGINGRKLELIVEDNKANNDTTKEVFNKLESSIKPDVYVSILTGFSALVSELANGSNAPFVAIVTAGPNKAILADRKWAFRTYAPVQKEIGTLLKMIKDNKADSVGVAYSDDAFGKGANEQMGIETKDMAISITSVPFKPDASDITQALDKLKDKKAIYIAGIDPQIRAAITHLRKINYSGIILADEPAALPAIRSMPEANGMFFPASLIYNKDFKEGREFIEKYESTYNKTFTHYVAKGYEFVDLLATLMAEKEVTRDSIRETLEGGFNYTGIFGDINHNSGDHDLSSKIFPAQNVNGEIKFLQ